MSPIEAVAPKPTLNGTANDTEKPAGTRRGRKPNKENANKEDNFIYCLDAGKGDSGAIVLSKPGPKKEILAQAIKASVNYYRLQKFSTPTLEETEDGKYEIVEKSVE